jgi:Polysaccharide deacetylase
MDAESLVHIYHGRTAPNRVALASKLRYGPEMAIPRVVDVFARVRMRQSFFIPSWCIERYPRAIELIVAVGHEIGHHGYIHENPNKLSRQQERYFSQPRDRKHRPSDGSATAWLSCSVLWIFASHARFAARGTIRLRRVLTGARCTLPDQQWAMGPRGTRHGHLAR